MTRDWDSVGFVTQMPVYRGANRPTPRKTNAEPAPQMVDEGFHRRHLDVQGSSIYNADDPFDLD